MLLRCLFFPMLLGFVASQTCQNWVSINETLYSRTYVPPTSPQANTARPLGYKVATYMFEGVRPCFTVAPTGGSGRHIEITWEMEQPGTLYIQVKGGGSKQHSNSRTGKICGTVPGGASSVNYEFFCEGNGCEGGTKVFWYRFVVESEQPGGGYDENWCNDRQSNFPSSLIPLPTNISPPTSPTTTSAASDVITRYVTTLAAVTCLLALVVSF